MFALLRALYASEDVVAGILFLWARLVAKGSTVDGFPGEEPKGKRPKRVSGGGGGCGEDDVLLTAKLVDEYIALLWPVRLVTS